MADNIILKHVIHYNVANESYEFIQKLDETNPLIDQLKSGFTNPYLFSQILLQKIKELQE